MKITAIICEYNPFTNGHAKHLHLAREETGADTVLCLMSGSFTQRGDAAVLDKYQRAEVAVRMGADIVLELPQIYAFSPADNFAYGAIKTLSAMPDVHTLSFGSECGDSKLLITAAQFLSNEPTEYKELLAEFLKEGNSFPKARSLALNRYAELHEEYSALAGILDKPNNILGIAYIQAVHKAGLSYQIHTVKREDNFNDSDVKGEYPSASAVRFSAVSGKLSDIKPFVPTYTYSLLETYRPNNTSLGDLCLYKFKGMSGYDLEHYYDIGEGLHNRLKIAAETAVSFEEFLRNAKTKKYTMARLKRLSLYALFDIKKETYIRATLCPPYLFILALNKERKDILSALTAATQNVLTRYSDIDKVNKSLRFLIKLDFQAQGTLNMINRSNYFNKTMILI